MSFYRACWWIAYGLARLLFRLRVEGRDHIPSEGGVVLASNHCSYVDPPLIGVAAGRELWYVAKQEVFPIPLLGWFIRKVNAMPIDRSSRGDRSGLAAIAERLNAGAGMILFPEGTRNKTGRFLAPKSGVGMMVYRAAVPVVPVYISGTVNVWKSLIGLSRVTVRFGAPIRFHPGQLPSRRKDAYQSISREVMRHIGNLKQGGRRAVTPAPVSPSQ